MSDLIGSQLPSGSGTSRPQNGGTRISQGPVPPVFAEQPRGVRTPTEVMRDRRAREARKRAAEEEAARNREREEQLRREQEEYDAGVVEERKPPIQDRRQENIPSTILPAPAAQQRTSANPTQPRPAPAQPNTTQSYEQNNPAVQSSSTRRHRNEALENLNIPANPTTKPVTSAAQAQPAAQSTAARSQFPHAFERWETLSSHWEGLTSYWIRRLQQNTDELDNKPIDQQLSRQIGDLSAAGANLFHAVVELQRLRASSERKFQRWFFETRTEQERAQEVQAQLQRQLETEREERNVSGPAVQAALADKLKSDDLVREMRRELQISKEEARRAWEELGRREQEERDRTVALRSGEPVMIGGVQVVPMAHGPSRGNTSSSANRPVTREGPIEGGPGPNIMSGQQARSAPSRSQTGTTLDSPGAEERQFTYERDSPTSTDPFTEGRAQASQYASSPMRATQPPTSSAAMAAASASTNPRFYSQATSTAIPLVSATSGPTPSAPTRPATSGTERSYVPSNISGGPSDDPATHRYDAAEYDDDDAEYDSEADRQRERMYAQQYARQSQPERTSQPLATYTSSSAAPGNGSAMRSPTAADLEAAAASANAQYSSAAGWEGLTTPSGGTLTSRHQHATRLSDILEERSGRTSPSRGSYISGAGERGAGAGTSAGEGYARR